MSYLILKEVMVDLVQLEINTFLHKQNNMKIRRLESDTRMRFLLGNNPIGEMVKLVSDECKRIEKTKGYGKQVSAER
jgi:chorismate-pyruvate lyase